MTNHNLWQHARTVLTQTVRWTSITAWFATNGYRYMYQPTTRRIMAMTIRITDITGQSSVLASAAIAALAAFVDFTVASAMLAAVTEAIADD